MLLDITSKQIELETPGWNQIVEDKKISCIFFNLIQKGPSYDFLQIIKNIEIQESHRNRFQDWTFSFITSKRIELNFRLELGCRREKDLSRLQVFF